MALTVAQSGGRSSFFPGVIRTGINGAGVKGPIRYIYLENESYQPYRKSNDKPIHINKKSNHPPSILKHLPTAISSRISDLSCNRTEFDEAIPLYEDEVQSSRYTDPLMYCNRKSSTRPKRSRQRCIMWYNPPYSKNV